MAKQPIANIKHLYLPHYVYELIDPRNNTTFYVGKGQGHRLSQHVKDVRRGKSSNSHKTNTIQEILDCNMTVVEKIVKDFHTDKEAISYEEELIATYGIDNLTNKMRKGSLSCGRRYHIEDFTNTVKLAISMLGRVQNVSDASHHSNHKTDITTGKEIFFGLTKIFSNLHNSIDKTPFLKILNAEIETNWKGESRCLY